MGHWTNYGRQEGRKQIVNTQAIQSLRHEKLSRVRLRNDPVTRYEAGEALNFISRELAGEFDIPDTPPVSSNPYEQETIDLIHNNPDKTFLDLGSGLRPTYYSNVINTEIYQPGTADVLCIGEDMPFSDDQFDFVFAFSVLEHTRKPWLVAREICRVLKPGGCAIIDYPPGLFNADILIG
jgi:SAM-dependent methyltransferase